MNRNRDRNGKAKWLRQQYHTKQNRDGEQVTMGEFELPILSCAKSPTAAPPPKSGPLQSIKREQDKIQLPLHTIPQASFAMDVKQQPGAAQFVPDGVEIDRFESTAVSDRNAPLMDMDTEEIQGEISAA